ncbi:MAG: DUF4395 domain-containing protein [Candidatus Velthaea sp.]|jgi:hypothetical protein
MIIHPAPAQSDCITLIPLSIVRLNRLTILCSVILAYVLHAPLITTALFVIVTLAAGFGRRASLIYAVGRLVLRPAKPATDGEDPRLMRFNNTLAAIILGLAQVAFVLHAPLVGWIFAGLAALAAAVALAGFCFGCFLFYQFKLNRARLFGSTK